MWLFKQNVSLELQFVLLQYKTSTNVIVYIVLQHAMMLWDMYAYCTMCMYTFFFYVV